MFANQPTASAGARREGPAMTVEVARAGRRDDRAPRTPAASVDRRAASPWMDAPGPASPAGSFRARPARRARRCGARATSAGGRRRRRERDAAPPPSGNVFTHEEKHAQAVRAGEARRASSSTARETILDAVRQMMERRAKERERDGRDPPPVDDDDDDDDIVKLRTSRGSLFSVEQIREWRRRAIAAQVAIRWRRKQRRESTWSFAVEDGVRHVLGTGSRARCTAPALGPCVRRPRTRGTRADGADTRRTCSPAAAPSRGSRRDETTTRMKKDAPSAGATLARRGRRPRTNASSQPGRRSRGRRGSRTSRRDARPMMSHRMSQRRRRRRSGEAAP